MTIATANTVANGESPIRIALVAHLSEVSGAGTALLGVARGLNPNRFTVQLILPGDGPLHAKAAAAGVDPVVVPNPERSFQKKHLLQSLILLWARLRYVVQLALYVRSWQADIVYVNSTASVFAGIAAKLARKPIVWHVHESLDKQTRSIRLKKWFIQNLSSGLLYASHTAQTLFPAPGVVRQLVVKNWVPVQEIANATVPHGTFLSEVGIPPGRKLIVANGLIRRKGADLLLQAFKQILSDSHENLHLVLIGEAAPDSAAFVASLHQWCEVNNLADRVTFAGLQPSLIPFLQAASVFVSASRNEALPISLIEALAAGTPIIATDVGDSAALLEHGCRGLLIPPENPQALANAILAVLDDPAVAQERVREGQVWVNQEYRLDGFWTPMEELLTAVAQT